MPTQHQIELAHKIIDMVEMAIREAHPEIDKLAQIYTVDGEHPNTLLYGGAYYDLENEIIQYAEKLTASTTGALVLEEIKSEDLSKDRVTGFVKIKQLGSAQQARISAKNFAVVAKMVAALKLAEFSDVWITVKKDMPVLVGGKETGFAVAPLLDE